MDEPKVRPHIAKIFRDAQMKVRVVPAQRWGFYVGNDSYWRPTKKMAVAKAKRILQAKLLEEPRWDQIFTITEADLD